MKLVIAGREYDMHAQPFIGDLRLLKKEFGFGWGEVARRLQGLDEGADVLSLLDNEDFIDGLLAWMWMARLRAGERSLTLDEVRMTPLDGIGFKAEPGDVEVEPDIPSSAPTGSGRGAAKPKPKQTKPSSKTSRKPCTAA